VKREPVPKTVKEAKEFIQEVFDIGPQRFDDWSRFELVWAILSENVEIRQEQNLPTDVLRSLAMEIFQDRKKPKRMEKFSVRHMKAMDIASRLSALFSLFPCFALF
jgi:hypothetical protein